MNKVVLMGRLVRDPEVRYSQSKDPISIARYSIAVDRYTKGDKEKETDFITCVALGKQGEFVEKYFKKGQRVVVSGSLRVRSWEDAKNTRKWATEVITQECYFADNKKVEAVN